MDNFDVPICKKSGDLYKMLHGYRRLVPKNDRFTIFERCENILMDIIEIILTASGQRKQDKSPTLEAASVKLNLLRVFVRLMKECKTIDQQKYLALENAIDEIGRMLGGWIRSTKTS